jgi:hypothetical protein
VDSLTGATRQWATPNSRDDHNPSTPDSPRTQRKLEQGWTIDLNEQAAWWTTPQTHDSAGGNPETAWPTPQAKDWKSGEVSEATRTKNSRPLNGIASHFSPPDQETPTHGSESSPSAQTSRRRLNPAFVDWLMGLPPGWTDYGPVETASWYSRQRMRLRSLLGEQG